MQQKTTAQSTSSTVKKWTFDAVAQNFVQHERQHIPAHQLVNDLTLKLATTLVDPQDKILEVGCGEGYTLRLLEQNGYKDLTGVDNSEALIHECVVEHARIILSDTFPSSIQGPFKLIFSHWALHFIPEEERRTYLQAIARNLDPKGVFLFTDKTLQTPFTQALYYGFKESQGVSREEIEKKRLSLQGVLMPSPVDWYITELKTLGFRVEILWAEFGFVTFMAWPHEEAAAKAPSIIPITYQPTQLA